MSDSVSSPKAEFFRKPNLSKNLPFRIVDWTHDMLIVKWREVTVIQFSESRISNVPKCGLNTRHDNREVTLIHLTTSANFALWQMRHRFNPRKWVNDYQRYSMLGAQVYVLYPRQFIFALSCKRRSFLQVLQSTEARKDILKNFLCIWWW